MFHAVCGESLVKNVILFVYTGLRTIVNKCPFAEAAEN
jgi:hypothetical protein